ncbi:MAG: cell division protein FtsQ/DivIB [Bacillota bacterium]
MENEDVLHDEGQERGGRWGFWLALLVMLAICLFAVYRSALFRLERVLITGNQRLSQADILEVTGLAPGMLRWEAPADRVQRRLEAEPRIRSATVAWKGNRLTIEIVEREPLALLQYHGRYYLVLDEEGAILGQRMLEEGDRLPVIAGLTVTSALRGQRLSHAGLLDVLSVLAWTAPPLRGQISEVQVREDRYIRLYMTGGTTVDWGVLPESPAERDGFIQIQLQGFGEFWEKIPRAKLATCSIDLRVKSKVLPTGCQ